METNYKKLFYMGIAYDACPWDGRKLKKNGLPVKKLSREFPYLLGEGRTAAEKLQVYFALLPEYGGKTLFGRKPKSWKADTAGRLLEEAQLRAERAFDCREHMMEPGLNGGRDQVLPELLAAYLYRQRPFDRICVSLPDEGGERELELAESLLCPYLPRIRQVVFRGKESGLSEGLEEYLYDEFGIVMVRDYGRVKDMPWLDLQEDGPDSFKQNLHDEPHDAERRYGTKGNGHISLATALKFLDTAVKNGYNTDVNSYRKAAVIDRYQNL